MSLRVPKYRLHKATGQAVMTLAGVERYLGRYGSEQSKAEYRRLVGEWTALGGSAPSRQSNATIMELMVPYIRHVDGYYVKDGKPTSEVTLIRLALKVLRANYGHAPAAEFGPLALKACRQVFIDADLCRTEVNRRTGLIVRFFRWAVENELVPPSLHHGLRAVPGLRKGRTAVRESKPIRPAPEEHVDAIRPYVARQVWTMVELQRLTGMRPGEVVIMRTCDLEMNEGVWLYVPSKHKTEHHEKRREIYLGPRAQELLRPWLRTDLQGYLFQAIEADAERKAAMRSARKTKVQPSQKDRRKPRPARVPGERYDVGSYRRAIAYGCAKAAVPLWQPNRLRHNAATRLRRDYGLDVARTILGHDKIETTLVYAEADVARAIEVMREAG